MQGYQLTFFTQQDRMHGHVPLAQWLLAEAKQLGIRGATLSSGALQGLGHDGMNVGSGFVRTHHSAAVALAHVTAVQPLGKGGARIVVRDGVKVPCSRQYRGAVLAQLRGRLRPRSPQLGDDLPHDAGAAVMRGLLWGNAGEQAIQTVGLGVRRVHSEDTTSLVIASLQARHEGLR